MKSILSLSLPSSRIFRWLAPLTLGVALLVAGCVTDDQVRSIVANSNAAMLSSQLGDLTPQADGTPAWQAANAQIEAFIAAHPDQKDAIAPLRVRQAMLLLANGQLNLARAAFDSVTTDDLHTTRDKALKAQEQHLVWWFGTSTAHTWTAADQAAFAAARTSLKAEYEHLEASPEIRDYLAEMCAWIGIAAAKQTTSAEVRRSRFEEALDDYARIFTANDKTMLVAGVTKLSDIRALTTDIRRCIRAEVVLRAAHDFNRDHAVGAHLADPIFQQLLDTPSP